MPIITIVLGVLLATLGLISRSLSDSASHTVLIPAYIGGVFVLLGVLALRQPLRKHAMHGAALIALLAIGGSIGGLIKLPALLAGAEVERPLAVVSRSITCLLCVTFLILAIRSFVVARLLRKASAAG